jgi:solute:Na+ symporter, SSS family
MSPLDYLVLLGTMIGIAAYGVWRTRGIRNPATYFRGDQTTRWGTIGISVMATQASAITFLSIPGQGYESGIGFVQNYFGLPLALIIIAVAFLPIYRKLNVYTAYEFLGRRFDSKTRLLGAGLFLLQRGLAAGVTIYAPAIILSTVLGWRLDLTILFTGVLVIVYTVTGGSEAVSLTQKYQMAVIFGGMVTAFIVVVVKMPGGLGLTDAAYVAGGLGKLKAVDFSFNADQRYTIWSGVLGGLFLSLSYFGTDQSQVQRYIGGAALREGRLGLMFNAVLKIPMQFSILLLGALVFVFYQFERPPVFFDQATWNFAAQRAGGDQFHALEEKYAAVHAQKEEKIRDWLAAKHAGNPAAEATARADMLEWDRRSEAVRAEARAALLAADPQAKTKDSDYVFITFILHHLPHGAIGLLVAVMFAAALSSKASELNALGTTTAVDFYRHLHRTPVDDAHYVKAARWFTALWGLFAIGFALFAHFMENLIEAINILGSIFYGVVLGIFLVAFFLKKIRGTAVFVAALTAQVLVIALYFTSSISYLWYNLIGCAACVGFSAVLQTVRGWNEPPGEGCTP